ncbi:SpoIIE family protein phosphatase [Candidatus Saccharibacteria bacterium]|nr:SpoIIE family protein phosphatase [Candidatus Saccharibacteria bacterium]
MGLFERFKKKPEAGTVDNKWDMSGVEFAGAKNGEKEPLVKAVGVAEVSKAQVMQGKFQRLEDDGTSQDASLLMPEKGIFGVFDGVGGSVGGRLASATAANKVAELGRKHQVRNALDLGTMLDMASFEINNTEGAGSSTGTLVKITEVDGKKMMMWTSVGDSRVYVVDNNGRASQISKDEGYENVITNALGGGGANGKRAMQAGTVLLNNGDRVVLCTDGITGDKGTDLMSERELGSIVGRAKTAELAAADLLKTARKRDDRTAIVVQI